jgi:hypothetical protein
MHYLKIQDFLQWLSTFKRNEGGRKNFVLAKFSIKNTSVVFVYVDDAKYGQMHGWSSVEAMGWDFPNFYSCYSLAPDCAEIPEQFLAILEDTFPVPNEVKTVPISDAKYTITPSGEKFALELR